MSHRNSKPKVSATERTWRRYRERHEISTVEDIQHFARLEEIKNELKEAIAKMFGGFRK